MQISVCPSCMHKACNEHNLPHKFSCATQSHIAVMWWLNLLLLVSYYDDLPVPQQLQTAGYSSFGIISKVQAKKNSLVHAYW